MSKPDIQGLQDCVEDARLAGLDQDPGPADPLDYHSLIGRLHAAAPKTAPVYRKAVLEPFLRELVDLGAHGFVEILIKDPRREGGAGLMLDIAHAILQRAEGYEPRALRAFQEVVSDLYDGFLSSEDRLGVEPPDNATIAPLIKFGSPDFGPYTWPVDATQNFGLGAAIVSLPPANARRGLLAWPTLGHETAGHDLLHADDGLLGQVSDAVRAALMNHKETAGLAAYWADRIDETASDVLGILNMGPAPGIGLIGYFRGLNAAFGSGPRLRLDGPADDPHPADILRGFLAAATVRQLAFAEAGAWADVIQAETEKDLQGPITLEGVKVSKEAAVLSAGLASRAIVAQPMAALENHAFGQIQNWRDTDEAIVDRLRAALRTAHPLAADLAEGVYAAHLVAAAVMDGLSQGADLALVTSRMIELLKLMNEKNPSFGPLFVRHPGSLTRDRTYIPAAGCALPEVTLTSSHRRGNGKAASRPEAPSKAAP